MKFVAGVLPSFGSLPEWSPERWVLEPWGGLGETGGGEGGVSFV